MAARISAAAAAEAAGEVRGRAGARGGGGGGSVDCRRSFERSWAGGEAASDDDIMPRLRVMMDGLAEVIARAEEGGRVMQTVEDASSTQ